MKIIAIANQKATLQALASLRTSDQVLADRGKKKEKAI